MAYAEREYRAALAVDPKLREAHNHPTVVCMLSGRYPEAEEDGERRSREGVRAALTRVVPVVSAL